MCYISTHNNKAFKKSLSSLYIQKSSYILLTYPNGSPRFELRLPSH